MSSEFHTADPPSARLFLSGRVLTVDECGDATHAFSQDLQLHPLPPEPSETFGWGPIIKHCPADRGGRCHTAACSVPSTCLFDSVFLASVSFVPPPLPVVSLGLILCPSHALAASPPGPPVVESIHLSPPYPRIQIYHMCDGSSSSSSSFLRASCPD